MSASWLITGLVILLAFVFLAGGNKQARKARQAEISANCENTFPDDTILVAISSQHDSLAAAYTIFDLYKKAYCPNRVFVAVCQFYAPSDTIDVLLKYKQICGEDDFSDNIRVISIKSPYRASSGMFFIQNHLYQREKYLLQVYSETTFGVDWDKICIEQLQACPSPKPLLIQLPLAIPENGKKMMPSFIRWRKEEALEGLLFKKRPKAPVPACLWCSDFVFSYADRFLGMPERRELLSEYALGLKAFTSGFDMFHPTRMIVEPGIRRGALRKNGPIGAFDIGKVRSLADYEYWSGIKLGTGATRAGYAGFNVVQTEEEQIRQKYGSRRLARVS